jgi:hypothetical protein
MTTNLLAGFDAYQVRARVYPALLTMLPLTVGAYAVLDLTPITGIAPVLVSAGVVYLLASVTRGLGLRAQARLIAAWGGLPTTLMLRHAEPAGGALRRRRHERLARLCGEPLPSSDEEADSPDEADERYAMATGVLIARVRQASKHFPRVQEELTHYGFRRNLYGLRPIGILMSLTAAGWMLGLLWLDQPSLPVVTALVVSSGAVALWAAVVTPAWVRQAGHRYAERLFEALESEELITPP